MRNDNMEQQQEIVRRVLVLLAKCKAKAYYSEIAPIVGLSHRSNRFFTLLDNINRKEHREGRPMLSALVGRWERLQSRQDAIPGSMFYPLAKELGLYGDDLSDRQIAEAEARRVYDWWAAD